MPKFIAKLSEQLVNVIGQMSADGEVTAAVEHTTFVTLAAPLVTVSSSQTSLFLSFCTRERAYLFTLRFS